MSRFLLPFLLFASGGGMVPGQALGPLPVEARWQEIRSRWPEEASQTHQEARRLELILLLHRLRSEEAIAPEIRRIETLLDELEANYCDRRDPELAARSVQLSPERLTELEQHLERHHQAFLEGEELGGLDLFRPIEICRYR